MILLAKYGTAFTFEIPVPKTDGSFAASADWTPATGDVKVSKDGGNVANIDTLPTEVGGTGSLLWTFTLSASEMTAGRVAVQISNAALQDDAILLFTFGNASAAVVFDLSVATQAVNTTQWGGTAVASAVVGANTTQLNGSATAAANLQKSALGVVSGAAQTGTLTTTQMTTDLTETTDDHYIGRVIIFTSGNLAGQATDITDYAGTGGLLTYTALTEAPANNDTFVIV